MSDAERDEMAEARAEVAALTEGIEETPQEPGAIDLPMTEYAVVSRLVATDRQKVRWMYREEPTEPADSGWRFFSGDEAENFAEDPENFEFHALDVVMEIDPSIAPHLERQAPVAFERGSPDDEFTEVTDVELPGQASSEPSEAEAPKTE
ncbi:MAG TPA: DUF2185 domain-containing protein [Longimicrobium sp.]|nr:DUF2185 domain-containing protein [Longimicrobium sp.]